MAAEHMTSMIIRPTPIATPAATKINTPAIFFKPKVLGYMSTDDPLTVAHVKFSIVLRKRASFIPLNLVFGRSKTRNAAKFAVYEATMIIAKPAQTIPKTRAEKLRGVPSPIPLFSNTPQANQTAELRFKGFSS
uniref:Uncharacterized protein n=1 Tax=Glossina palpalis gambiensis TaxID=67801 RepID=A0A1B0AXG8_9MUSC